MALASAGSSATRTAKPAALTNLGITLEQPGRAGRTKSEWRYLRGRSGGLPQTIVILSRMVVRVLRSGGARLLDSADKMYFDHRIRPGPEGHGSRGGLVLRVVPDRPEVGPAPWRSLRPDERHLRAQRSWLAHVPFLRMVLLVLLHAQGPAAISRLTLDHVHVGEQHVRLRLGREPIVLPGPLDAIVLQLSASRRGHAALGDQGSSRWLFPGGQPGQPISAYRLAQRLRQLGLRPGPLNRPVRPRHRTPRSLASATARHPHQRRRRLATSLLRETGPPTKPTTADASADRRTSTKAPNPTPPEGNSEGCNI